MNFLTRKNYWRPYERRYFKSCINGTFSIFHFHVARKRLLPIGMGMQCIYTSRGVYIPWPYHAPPHWWGSGSRNFWVVANLWGISLLIVFFPSLFQRTRVYLVKRCNRDPRQPTARSRSHVGWNFLEISAGTIGNSDYHKPFLNLYNVVLGPMVPMRCGMIT